jgi:hypothetical protein
MAGEAAQLGGRYTTSPSDSEAAQLEGRYASPPADLEAAQLGGALHNISTFDRPPVHWRRRLGGRAGRTPETTLGNGIGNASGDLLIFVRSDFGCGSAAVRHRRARAAFVPHAAGNIGDNGSAGRA